MLFADSSAGTMKIRNAADNAFIELFQLDGTFTLEDGSASTPALAFRDDLNTGIFSSAADTFDIATGGVARFQIDSSEITFNESGGDTNFRVEGDTNANLFFLDAGNNRVGLGTNSPDQFLTVIGDTSIQGRIQITASTPDLLFSVPGGGLDSRIHNDGSGNLLIGNGDNSDTPSERLRIDSSGNVGIGTSSPGALLHTSLAAENGSIAKFGLSGQTNNQSFIIKADDSDSLFTFRFGSGNSTYPAVRFNMGADVEALRINSSGNVLINTTQDFSLINGRSNLVVGSGSGNEGITIFTGSSNSGGIAFADGTSGTEPFRGQFEYNHSSDSFTFVTATSLRMTIDGSGNIGAPSGTNIFNASDSRVKTNVVNLDKGLSVIKSLRPVSFNWIDGFCNEEKGTLYGFIAQEVKAVDNNLIQDFAAELTINENKIENVLRVNEKFIIPMLVKAIQELEAKVEALEAA